MTISKVKLGALKLRFLFVGPATHPIWHYRAAEGVISQMFDMLIAEFLLGKVEHKCYDRRHIYQAEAH